MEPYGYALGVEAVHAFTAQNARERERLIAVFDRLALHPFELGDYNESGQSGRIYEVTLIGDLLVTWWADHASREIRVVRLEWA